MPNPVEIRFLSVNVTPDVGANDSLVAVRVVPAGRDGTKVYGRTLKPGEVDLGTPVTYDPYAGEKLHFGPGSVQITIQDVDRMAKPGPDGYATISNTVWTWFKCRGTDRPRTF